MQNPAEMICRGAYTLKDRADGAIAPADWPTTRERIVNLRIVESFVIGVDFSSVQGYNDRVTSPNRVTGYGI